jgi:vitamin B12 transporter
MQAFLQKAGKLILAATLVVFLRFPLFSQENGETEEDTFDDEILLMEGEGITVTESPETTQQMKVVTKDDIDRLHAPDLATLLQEALDLGRATYGAYGMMSDINMRGFDSERIAFLIDGVPANSPQSGEFELSQLNLDAIDRIEVIYGGSDTKYNVTGALGGVINIITVKKQKPGLRISGGISNLSTLPGEYYKPNAGNQDPQWQDLADTQNLTLSAGYGAEKFSVSVNTFTNRAGNHFLYEDYYKRTRRKEVNEIWDAGASTSLVWDLPDLTKLIASGDVYYGDKNIPDSATAATGSKQFDFSTRQNLMLDMPRAFRDDLATEASLSHTWQTLKYGETASASLHDEHLLTAINRWSWFPFSKLTLRTGGDYRYITLDSTDMGIHDRHDGGLYLTVEYKPHEKFLIIPSIKGAFSDTRVVPVPKLGFLWTPTEALTLKLNGFRIFKFPDFQDLYWSGGGASGNPDLKPEDGWGGDLGGAYVFTDWLSLESTIFGQWYNDSIHWYTVGRTLKPVNVGGSVFFGLDSKLEFSIPLKLGPVSRIGLSFSYQYMLSYLLAYGYTFADDKRIPYMPDHTVGFSIDLPWNTDSEKYAGSILLSGHYETMRYTDNKNISTLDPYFLLNLHVNQKLGKNFTTFAVFRNLLNSSYQTFLDYPMPGLTITLGVRMNIEGIGAGNKSDAN